MTLEQVLQAGISIVAASTPLLVVSIARGRTDDLHIDDAAAAARTRRSYRRLAIATALISVPLVALALRVRFIACSSCW
jgi:hypothetical protein